MGPYGITVVRVLLEGYEWCARRSIWLGLVPMDPYGYRSGACM